MNTEQFNGHTPGPWRLSNGTIWGGEEENFVSLALDVEGSYQPKDPVLMAAAPELLDALIDARRMVQELHALLNGADGDEAYEWALRNIGEQEMAWWRTYYVRRS